MTPEYHRHNFTREKIDAKLRRIASTAFRRRADIEPFRLFELPGPVLEAPLCADPTGWQEIPHESYWGRADLNFVLKSGFVVPEDWPADKLALHLPLGVLGDIFNHPEAMVYLDNMPLGSADRYHHTIPLPEGVADGQRHVLSLHGWTGHAGWPPDPTSRAKLFMGRCKIVERDFDAQHFHRLAGAVLDAINQMEEGDETRLALLEALDAAVLLLDTRDPIEDAFYASLPAAISALEEGVAKSGEPLDVKLHGIGHAHMDIAYLWPIAQMRLKNQRTYSNVLRLMRDNPDYKFSHSQPALYEMVETDYPILFEEIRQRIQEGRWEVIGGMWVEPDLNTPGSEALVRQLTLGRRYFQDRFGEVETPVLWLPDTFGFPNQIPQLMKLAGLDWFVTNKLNWNQVNRVSPPTHIWEGLDGSQVLAHILTTPRDVQYLPFPTNYKSDLSAYEVLGTWTNAEDGAATDLPICYGFGDGGGGPTEDLIARARVYADMPGMPQMVMSTVREAMMALETRRDTLPVWQGEHYLEGHRGVYTSQGWIKRANRKAEIALHEAEALAVLAGQSPDLEEAWKLLCLNQFHDIITGTSIGEVYEDSRRDYARIAELTDASIADSSAILTSDQTLVASTLPTTGTRVVESNEAETDECQKTETGFLHLLPSLEPYSLTPLANATAPDHPVRLSQEDETFHLENEHLSVRISKTGQLVSVIDRITDRVVVQRERPANLFTAFEDNPICWDAWDIDPYYEEKSEPVGAAQSVEIIESGPIRVMLRFRYQWRDSTFVQDVSLCADSHRLDFQTKIDWHQTHTLLKIAFPVSVSSDFADFDTQWGVTRRSTLNETPFDAARFEVPAHKWAELADDQIAVAVMNDCKYGYDVKPDQIRLTLIKSATSPDPKADQGHHEFTYALMVNPTKDIARRNHAAYDLNAPARIIPSGGSTRTATGTTLAVASAPNIIIETVKPADKSAGFVLRLFECGGAPTKFNTTLDEQMGPFRSASIVSVFEEHVRVLDISGNVVELDMEPFQIVTVLVRPEER